MAKRRYLPLLPELVDDLVIEILACLPVKLLLQFKCVSKSWCNLIKSDALVSTHFRKQNGCSKLVLMRHILVQPSSKEESMVLSFHDPDSPQMQEVWPSLTIYRFPSREYGHSFHRLLGPCNGLVLVVDQEDVLICNPSLRELEPLPRCPFSDNRGYYRVLPRNNLVDWVISGWGFGSTSAHDFSVVHLQCCYKRESVGGGGGWVGKIVSRTCTIKAHLYKSTTSSWKDLGYVDTVFTKIGFQTSELFSNGACHWHAELLAQDHPGVILTFDMSNEIFRHMEYPKQIREYHFTEFKLLMVLNDCIALFWGRSNVNSYQEIWVMNEYGNEESWSKLLVIGPVEIQRPLLFWQNEMLFANNEGQLASCAFYTNELKRYPSQGVPRSLRAVTYKESLISPKTKLSLVNQ